MGRLYVIVGVAVILMVMLISSASHGFISRVPDWSRKGKLALAGALCLAGAAGWFYLNGGFDYLMWRFTVASRPDSQIAFVSLVQSEMSRWDDARPASAAACRHATESLEARARQVLDWSGTVYTAYRVGTRGALVVRVGRYTLLRTSYNEAPDAILLEPGSAVFKQVFSLEAGDPVQFSGAIVPGASGCAFQRDLVGQDLGAAFVFRFSELRRG
jgi:hypothetical protein